MQRKRVQPGKKPVKRTTRKKVSKKPPVPFSEMVLNWVIIVLAIVILVFLASMLWRVFFSDKEIAEEEQPPVQEQVETVQEVIRLEVLNGCGAKGVANQFSDFLRNKGFDVVNTGNYRNYDVDSSFVIDRRSMRLYYGNLIAESLGIKTSRVNRILSEELDLEATVVLGKDYQSLAGYSQ